ncbi:MAG TPA: hypothetical protein VF669_04540 [Tepidisphaeraceae bacterium]|jgi:hypothetical protein
MTYPDFNRYQPVGGNAPFQPRSYARRAGTLLMILGILMASFGLCNAVTAARVSPEQMLAEQAKLLPPDQPMPLTPEQFRMLAVVMAVAIVIAGLVLLGLSILVRDGHRGGTVAATVCIGGLLALLVLVLLMTLIATTVAPAFAAFLCMLLVPASIMGLQFWWLVQALRNGSPAPGAAAHYAQYWQYYQQQQQSPSQGPYTPPPPPPTI